jgi:hypothetical protein
MSVSPRSGAVVRKNYTRTVLREIQPGVEQKSRRELFQVSNGSLHALKRSMV